ncbi:MAG: hypothetical protein A3G24_08620 [Betaproteobacteria bacterium RIFCSPLOWO2_12_FULL_62_13]|nr:MAG: hypothetical protein A3G24_08620 [Betaproteobacteria bacterium RIFCSPLOWO2_12_FULL_62_13]
MTDHEKARKKILHILNDGEDELSGRMIEAHALRHEVRVVDLRRSDVSYERLVDEILAHDKVISW